VSIPLARRRPRRYTAPQQGESMRGILGLVILVLDIVAIIDCAKSNLDTGRKVLWIILILVLPVLGLILYSLVGKKST
jgi:hypothetical protein